jgi:long-chain acyl-CoA synthetase
MAVSTSAIGWLTERMAGWSDAPAMAWRGHLSTYGDLLDLRESWSNRLARQGVRRGEVVAVDGDYSPNTCALLLALVERGAIIVPLTKAIAAHRTEFLETAEVERVIDFDEADEWRIEQLRGPASHPLIRQLTDMGTPGLIVFSSGSTGKNKASLHDFERLLEKFKVPRQRLTTLNFLMFDHLGGINTMLYTLSNGGTVVSTRSRDPEGICELIERHRIELLPASPTFLNLLLLSEAHKQFDLSSLRLITYGTEVMPESTLVRVREAFPEVRLQQTYGLSELGVLRSKSRDDGSLWVKVGGEGTETKVVDGVLWIRAQSAMLGYLNAPSPFDEEGWMNTQDCVEVDGEYIRILGRRSELINVGGQKVYPAEVESVLMQMDEIHDVTVYGEPNPITGRIVVALVRPTEPIDAIELRRRVRAHCRGKLAPYKVPGRVIVGEHDLFSARYKKVRQV